MGIALSELAQRSLEVVAQPIYVVVCGGQCMDILIECDARGAFGVGATVIHVIAQQVGARSKLHDSHRIGILRIDEGTAMVGRSHAATQLTGEVGIVVVALGGLFLLFTQQVGSDDC